MSWLDKIHAEHADWALIGAVQSEHPDFSKADYAKIGAENALGKIGLEMEIGKENTEEEEKHRKITEKKNQTMEKSPEMKVVRLSELKERPERLFSTEQMGLLSDKLLSRHAARLQDGFVLTVPAGKDAGEIIIRSEAEAGSALHHVFILEKGAKARIVLEAGAGLKNGRDDSPALHTDLTEAFLGEDSNLSLTTIQDYPAKDLAFSHYFHTLGKFAKLSHTAASFGASLSRTRAVNHLQGVRAHADSYQIFAGGRERKMDLGALTHHAVPDTGGKMTCRGALSGACIGIYKGKIRIDRAGADTVSHQSGSALLLSPRAKAFIIPALEVENNQVEAGHGASIGGLDGQEMTYLRSRGLSEEEAKRLLLKGFFDSLIDKNESPAARRMLEEKLAQKEEELSSGT